MKKPMGNFSIGLELGQQDIGHIRKLEMFLKSPAGEFLMDYLRAKREHAVIRAMNYNSEVHYRKQQGYVIGFDECIKGIFDLMQQAENEIEKRREAEV